MPLRVVFPPLTGPVADGRYDHIDENSCMQKTPILILSAGMPRSGSTWMYNVLRLLLNSWPGIGSRLGAGWYQDIDRMMGNPYVLLKLHFHTGVLCDKAHAVFYSYRDIRDALASQQRRFGGEASMQWADEYVRSHEQWMLRADYVMKYEDMLYDKPGIVAGLARSIGERFPAPSWTAAATWSVEEIIAEIEGMSYESPGPKNPDYNEVTLFHPRHMTDGRRGSWRETLDPGLAAAVEAKYRWWFHKCGYELDGEGPDSKQVPGFTMA